MTNSTDMNVLVVGAAVAACVYVWPRMALLANGYQTDSERMLSWKKRLKSTG